MSGPVVSAYADCSGDAGAFTATATSGDISADLSHAPPQGVTVDATSGTVKIKIVANSYITQPWPVRFRFNAAQQGSQMQAATASKDARTQGWQSVKPTDLIPSILELLPNGQTPCSEMPGSVPVCRFGRRRS